MTIGHAGFQYASTTTPGKLNIIQWQQQLVHNIYNNMQFDGKGLSIPGHHTQLARHIKELKAYGIKEENQIMVECSYGTYLDLVREAGRLGFKGKVVHGYLEVVVGKLWDAGEQVDVIDFDDIGYLGPTHTNLLKEAFDNDIKVFIGVFATRGNRGGLNQFQLSWVNSLGITPYRHRRGNMTYSLNEIQGEAMKHIANSHGYYCRYMSYMGRSTMVSCVVTKKPNPGTIMSLID